MSKLLTTPTLVRLNLMARRKKYSRTLEGVDRVGDPDSPIDPQGIHIAKSLLVHGDAECVRCQMFLKLKDRDKPVEGVLDIELGEYNRLQTYEQYAKAAGLPEEVTPEMTADYNDGGH